MVSIEKSQEKWSSKIVFCIHYNESLMVFAIGDTTKLFA